MKKTAFALLAVAFAGSVMAQNTITNATGVVTVTDPTGKVLQSVKIGDVVPDGSTLSTTGSVTVSVGGGTCTATLSSGQSIAVTPAACQAFVAQAGGTGAGAGGVFTPINLALGVGGLALLSEATKGKGNNNANPAIPATPATPGVQPAKPATPAKPARPISPT